MRSRLTALWWRIRDSLWFVPALLVVAATVLAAGLVELDSAYSLTLQERWPRLFGVGADGSRGLLSAIATAMLTVAGTMFSITLAVLSLAASQYSPRVLRTFVSDRPTQLVLGYFVAVFAYCLMVLRTIQAPPDPFVPSLAVLTGIGLAFVAVAALVFFIHHLSSSIQPSTIIERVGERTAEAIDTLFPEELGEEEAEERLPADLAAGPWTPALCAHTGYIITVDNAALLGLARREGRVVRMELAVGDFALKGQPLASLQGPAPVTEAARTALNGCYAFDRQRSIEQDAAFGLQQIVDIALKALSPGINDQSTALLCIDRLSALLAHLAARRVESLARRDDEGLRVLVRGPTFAGLVRLVFGDLAENAGGRSTVLAQLLRAIERIAEQARHGGRRASLAEEAARIAEQVQRTVAAPAEREPLLRRAESLQRALRGASG